MPSTIPPSPETRAMNAGMSWTAGPSGLPDRAKTRHPDRRVPSEPKRRTNTWRLISGVLDFWGWKNRLYYVRMYFTDLTNASNTKGQSISPLKGFHTQPLIWHWIPWTQDWSFECSRPTGIGLETQRSRDDIRFWKNVMTSCQRCQKIHTEKSI